MLSGMFSVSEAQAAAIRDAYEQGGELAAAVELRRHFRGIDSTAQARQLARIIAGWKPPTDVFYRLCSDEHEDRRRGREDRERQRKPRG